MSYPTDAEFEEARRHRAPPSQPSVDRHFSHAVEAELASARKKFPDTGATMVALVEEVGELAKALLDESWDRVWAEAVQVAAMAQRVAVEGDPTLDSIRLARVKL